MAVTPMAKTVIRQAVTAAITGAIKANRMHAALASPADIPTPDADLPQVIVRNGTEHKQSGAKQNANFTTTVTLLVEGLVSASDVFACQDALDILGAEIEDAVFRDQGVLAPLQEITSVVTSFAISSEGRTHNGWIKLLIDFETFESFPPQDQPDFEGVDLKVDLAGPFDATGTYPPPTAPVYPVPPAPRTSGPEGRVEGEIHVDLPQ